MATATAMKARMRARTYEIENLIACQLINYFTKCSKLSFTTMKNYLWYLYEKVSIFSNTHLLLQNPFSPILTFMVSSWFIAGSLSCLSFSNGRRALGSLQLYIEPVFFFSCSHNIFREKKKNSRGREKILTGGAFSGLHRNNLTFLATHFMMARQYLWHCGPTRKKKIKKNTIRFPKKKKEGKPST